jgi:hypothetical protein
LGDDEMMDMPAASTYQKIKQETYHGHCKYDNGNLLYEFYKTPFCRTRFLGHDECSEGCYKANKCDKMAYKKSVIQYSFYFAGIINFKLKKKLPESLQ